MLLGNSGSSSFSRFFLQGKSGVEPEDTLWTIAARTVGDQQDIRRYIYDVQKINGIQDPGALQAGQVIRLPRQ